MHKKTPVQFTHQKTPVQRHRFSSDIKRHRFRDTGSVQTWKDTSSETPVQFRHQKTPVQRHHGEFQFRNNLGDLILQPALMSSTWQTSRRVFILPTPKLPHRRGSWHFTLSSSVRDNREVWPPATSRWGTGTSAVPALRAGRGSLSRGTSPFERELAAATEGTMSASARTTSTPPGSNPRAQPSPRPLSGRPTTTRRRPLWWTRRCSLARLRRGRRPCTAPSSSRTEAPSLSSRTLPGAGTRRRWRNGGPWRTCRCWCPTAGSAPSSGRPTGSRSTARAARAATAAPRAWRRPERRGCPGWSPEGGKEQADCTRLSLAPPASWRRAERGPGRRRARAAASRPPPAASWIASSVSASASASWPRAPPAFRAFCERLNSN